MGPGKVNESVLRIDHHHLVPGRDLCCVHDLVDDYYFLAIVVDSSSSPWFVSVCSISSTRSVCGCLSLDISGLSLVRGVLLRWCFAKIGF